MCTFPCIILLYIKFCQGHSLPHFVAVKVKKQGARNPRTTGWEGEVTTYPRPLAFSPLSSPCFAPSPVSLIPSPFRPSPLFAPPLYTPSSHFFVPFPYLSVNERHKVDWSRYIHVRTRENARGDANLNSPSRSRFVIEGANSPDSEPVAAGFYLLFNNSHIYYSSTILTSSTSRTNTVIIRHIELRYKC